MNSENFISIFLMVHNSKSPFSKEFLVTLKYIFYTLLKLGPCIHLGSLEKQTDKKNIYGIYYSSWQVMICLFQQWPSINRKSRNLIIAYFMMLDVSASLEYTTIQQKQILIPVKEWTFQESEVSSKCLLLSVLFI